MGPSGRFTHVGIILDCLGQVNAGFIQVLYLGRAPRTKEILPNFLKWRRVTRHPLVFRGLTGSQRTPGFWGVTANVVNGDVAEAAAELESTLPLECRWRVPLTWVYNPSSVLLLYRDQLDAQTLDQVMVYVNVDGSIVI